MPKPVRRAALKGSRFLRRAAGVLDRVGGAHLAAIEQTMSGYDMAADPDEAYYLEQYMHWIEPVAARLDGAPARILDVGSGQGRLALHLAQRLPAATVVGVDVAAVAIEAMRAHAAERGVENLELHVGDAAGFLAGYAPESVDLVLFTEVSFWLERRTFDRIMEGIARVLRPGGTLVASFRPQRYNLEVLVSQRSFEAAALVRDARTGHIHGDAVPYTWHTVEDVRRELTQLGLDVDTVAGIGVLSGIQGDPRVSLARPSALTGVEREALLALELSLAEADAANGRYILAVARKR